MAYRALAMVKLGTAVVIAALLVAACSRDSDPGGIGPTVPTRPQTTTTTDPYAVPQTIDEAYVERVLAALNKIEGDAVREIVANEAVVPSAAEKLKAIYLADELNAQLRGWNAVVDEGFDDFHKPPGNVSTEVDELLVRQPQCIFMKATDDVSALALGQESPHQNWMGLRPHDQTQDPNNVNPTPWMVALKVLVDSGAAPRDPCG